MGRYQKNTLKLGRLTFSNILYRTVVLLKSLTCISSIKPTTIFRGIKNKEKIKKKMYSNSGIVV